MVRGCVQDGVLSSNKSTVPDFAFHTGDVLLCASSGASRDPAVHPQPYTFMADRYLEPSGKFRPPTSSQLVVCVAHSRYPC